MLEAADSVGPQGLRRLALLLIARCGNSHAANRGRTHWVTFSIRGALTLEVQTTEDHRIVILS